MEARSQIWASIEAAFREARLLEIAPGLVSGSVSGLASGLVSDLVPAATTGPPASSVGDRASAASCAGALALACTL